ncbi:glucosamine-6-phosphate deaminase [Staphylococcus cohnii]|uniref:glucosamine-6-phosphate deaminase n=1 Tax=Staphylococcus cohnii TaxID=29382 RepID=UPI000D1BE826|nr:glucosamine-6-phosphate deaminase [Staphylococcus cohnii]MBB2507003.1 Glucosamine-6-phosphate deaminase [Staphylococcus cohnii subsp. barensis]PTF05638.1 glucosamine-6-phosphate deaminase [Staphylococcus cohnii]PTG68747.1 glucosamine-6-phosphate deaminase [Staphylococcus cohnii]
MYILNLENRQLASQYVAIELLKQMKLKPDSVLGLATGNTMTDVYKYLKTLINNNNLQLDQIVTFNLDEYVGLSADNEQSYHAYMYQQLFKHHQTWHKENIFIPQGDTDNLEQECLMYEQYLKDKGPADIQILGIGENGHIGFNEPGSSFESVTRVVDLSSSTINANSRYFDSIEDVPKQAISMGLASIMRAKRIVLLAMGRNKKEAISQLIEGDISEALPASILHQHPHVDVIVDNEVFEALNQDQVQRLERHLS